MAADQGDIIQRETGVTFGCELTRKITEIVVYLDTDLLRRIIA